MNKTEYNFIEKILSFFALQAQTLDSFKNAKSNILPVFFLVPFF